MPMEAIPTLVGLPEPPKIIMYTTMELVKIYSSGAILVIAVLLLTYYSYRYYRARYENWLLAKEYEEDGILHDEIPIDVGINGNVFFIIGLSVCLVGLIQILL